MEVNEQIAIDHGLKKEEYQKLQSLVFFLRCGMNIVLINHPDFI